MIECQDLVNIAAFKAWCQTSLPLGDELFHCCIRSHLAPAWTSLHKVDGLRRRNYTRRSHSYSESSGKTAKLAALRSVRVWSRVESSMTGRFALSSEAARDLAKYPG